MQRRPGAELGRSWFWCILITAGQVNFAMSAERFGDRRRGGGAGAATGLTRQVLVGCGLRERRRRPYCVVVIRRPIRRGRDERRSSPGGRRTRGTASRGAGRGRSADEDVDARSVGRLDADASPETGVRASRITKDLSRRRRPRAVAAVHKPIYGESKSVDATGRQQSRPAPRNLGHLSPPDA